MKEVLIISSRLLLATATRVKSLVFPPPSSPAVYSAFLLFLPRFRSFRLGALQFRSAPELVIFFSYHYYFFPVIVIFLLVFFNPVSQIYFVSLLILCKSMVIYASHGRHIDGWFNPHPRNIRGHLPLCVRGSVGGESLL